MSERMLSQEEIELLLKGALQEEQTSEEDLTLFEKDAIGEVANISMGTASTALSQLLGKKVEITTPQVDLMNTEQIGDQYPDPAISVKVEFTSGLEGYNLFILSKRDGAVIYDLMVGGNGLNPPDELGEMEISAIAEAMNQMMGSAATSMSSLFGLKVDISPPDLLIADFKSDQTIAELLKRSEPLVRIAFRLQVEGVIDSILAQIIPLRIVKEMVASMVQSIQPDSPPQAASVAEIQPKFQTTVNERQQFNVDMPKQDSLQNYTADVQPAHFGELRPIKEGPARDNLDLILDVPLQVSVELGKAKKTIREIMNLAPGAVIELDRLAGEPVDMVVNGKLIAKCEVVVINETFGIRITDIVHPSERLKGMS